ncbi:MAG: hypothetical protein RLZ98_3711 [Pseudomonadota bacterium]|jgi:hypothetical protein
MVDQYAGLISHIHEAISSDDADQSQRLADLYLSTDDAGKELLDRAFTCLCGWQLNTLMRQVQQTQTVVK